MLSLLAKVKMEDIERSEARLVSNLAMGTFLVVFGDVESKQSESPLLKVIGQRGSRFDSYGGLQRSEAYAFELMLEEHEF